VPVARAGTEMKCFGTPPESLRLVLHAVLFMPSYLVSLRPPAGSFPTGGVELTRMLAYVVNPGNPKAKTDCFDCVFLGGFLHGRTYRRERLQWAST
jgi:hypothetical protein